MNQHAYIDIVSDCIVHICGYMVHFKQLNNYSNSHSHSILDFTLVFQEFLIDFSQGLETILMKIFWMVQVSLLCSNITQYNLFIFSVWLLGNSVIVPQLVSVWTVECVHTHTRVQRVAHKLRHKHSSSPVSSRASRVMVIVKSWILVQSGDCHFNIREVKKKELIIRTESCSRPPPWIEILEDKIIDHSTTMPQISSTHKQSART